MADLNSWVAAIGQWHRMAFPWAKLPHILDKLSEEKAEANIAWSREDDPAVADELADCLICVLAAMAREGIAPEVALASKFVRVQAKYAEPQPDPARQMALFALNSK